MSTDIITNILQQYDASEITPLARRNMIRSTLPGFMEQGTTASEALQIYKSSGIGIKEGDFYTISREVQGIETRSNRIQFVRRDSIPTEGIFEPLRRAQSSKYFYVVEYDYYDEETGELRTGWFGAETNLRSSRAMIEDQLGNYINERYQEVQAGVHNIRVRKAFINLNI